MNNRPIQVPPVRNRTDLGPRGFDPDSTFRLPAARIGAGDSRRFVRVAATLDSIDERWHIAYTRHLAARFAGSGIFALDPTGAAVAPPPNATVISVDQGGLCRPLASPAAAAPPDAGSDKTPAVATTTVSLVRSVLSTSTEFFRTAGRGHSRSPPPASRSAASAQQQQQQQAFTLAAAFTPRVFAAMLAAFEIASAAILARAAVAGSAAAGGAAAATADGKAKAKAKAAAATTSIFASQKATDTPASSQAAVPSSPTTAFFQAATHSVVSSTTPRATARLDAAYWAVLSAGALANTAASTIVGGGTSSATSSQSGVLMRPDGSGLGPFDIPPPPVWYPLLEDLRIDLREALVLAGFGTVKVSGASLVETEENLLEAALLAWARRAATAMGGGDASSGVDPLAVLWLSQMQELHDDVRAYWLCKRAAVGAALFPQLRRQPVEPRGGFAPTTNWTSPTASQQQQQQLGVAHALARNSMVNEPFHDEPFLFRELRDIAVHWRPDVAGPQHTDAAPAASSGSTNGANGTDDAIVNDDDDDDAATDCSTHSSLSSLSGDDDEDDDADLTVAAACGEGGRRRRRDEEERYVGGISLKPGCDPTVYAYARRARALARAVLVREQLRLEHIELALAELAFVRAAATDAAVFDRHDSTAALAVVSCGGVAEGTLRGLSAFGADLGVNFHHPQAAHAQHATAAAYDADDAVVTAAPRDAATGRPHFAADHALHVVASVAALDHATTDVGATKSIPEARRAHQRDAAVAAELLRVGSDE